MSEELTGTAETGTPEGGIPLSPESQPAPAPAPDAEPTTPAEPTAPDFSKIIGPDGKFAEGWKNSLPESIREELSLDTFGDLPEMAKQLVNAQKMIGKHKIVMPTEKSSQEEWDAFYNTIGRPKNPDEYKIDAPTDLEMVDMSQQALSPYLERMHQSGATQKQVDAALGSFTDFMRQFEQSVKEQEQQAQEEADRAVAEKSGEALDDQMHFANKLIHDFYPDEAERDKVLAALNDPPMRAYAVNLLARIQQELREPHGGIPQGSSATGAMTPAQLEAKAQELMETPGYADGKMRDASPAQYKRLTSEISELYNRAQRAKNR